MQGLNAVKNEEMLGTRSSNDKEGQAQEKCRNLAFAIATNGKTDEIPLLNGKYVRIPYYKVTLDNAVKNMETSKGLSWKT
ncbi:MAG: hypothetical protein ACLUGJ_01335 [Blautia wexlerae]